MVVEVMPPSPSQGGGQRRIPAKPDGKDGPRSERWMKRKAAREAENKIADSGKRDQASDLGADMMMGLFVTETGEQLPEGRLIYAQIFRRMGYGDTFIGNGRRPRWWPGPDIFRRLVAWKVVVRKMQQTFDVTKQHPLMGPVMALAVEEMGKRLAQAPQNVSDRDLTDLITKMARLFNDPRENARTPAAPSAPLRPGEVRMSATVETIMQLPEGAAREKALADYRRALEMAKEAIDTQARAPREQAS